jgi:murein L,D-transpeptidase YcbB/YkuD
MRLCVPALVFALSAGACTGSEDAPDPEPKATLPHPQLQAALSATAPPATAAPDSQARGIWPEARRFYEENGYQLVWSDGARPQRVMDALVRAVRAAGDEGLEPADYDVERLAAERASFDPARATDVDLAFTYAFLKYGWHLSRGSVRPEDVDKNWRSSRPPADLPAALQAALAGNRVEQTLKALAPSAPPYQGLRTQLAQHRALAAKGEPLPTGAGELSIADRIALIEVNMDRWRWMPDDFGPRYVFVNIPAFHLDAFENGQIVLDMKVVTGRKEDPTPVFADQMTHVVFSPYWNIPPSIVKNEIMPQVDRDPDYLERNNIEAVGTSGREESRLRQRPGPRNSLGFVKFMFPNNFNVYLHDTPADALFNRATRNFSHGCVRLERPMDLAKYVLRDQPEWTEERIKSAMHGGAERTVKVNEPLPVYIAYFTAWEDKGTLQIRPDVYGHDRRHLE